MIANERMGRARRALVGVAVAVVAAATISGCGLRLDEPPPASPSPDATETMRRTMVAHEQSIEQLAQSLAATTGDPSWQTYLTALLQDSRSHLSALGEDAPTGTASPSPTSTLQSSTPSASASANPPSQSELIDSLRGELTSAAADALTLASSQSAADVIRMLVSMSAYYQASQWQLAGLTGADQSVADLPAPSAVSAPTAKVWTPVVLAGDEIGYTYEVCAPHSSQEQQLAADGTQYRSYGEQWAQALDISGTSSDPRKATYPSPVNTQVSPATPITIDNDQDVAVALQTVWTNAATVFRDVAVSAPADQRSAARDGVTRAQVNALQWGATLPAFP